MSTVFGQYALGVGDGISALQRASWLLTVERKGPPSPSRDSPCPAVRSSGPSPPSSRSRSCPVPGVLHLSRRREAAMTAAAAAACRCGQDWHPPKPRFKQIRNACSTSVPRAIASSGRPHLRSADRDATAQEWPYSRPQCSVAMQNPAVKTVAAFLLILRSPHSRKPTCLGPRPTLSAHVRCVAGEGGHGLGKGKICLPHSPKPISLSRAGRDLGDSSARYQIVPRSYES